MIILTILIVSFTVTYFRGLYKYKYWECRDKECLSYRYLDDKFVPHMAWDELFRIHDPNKPFKISFADSSLEVIDPPKQILLYKYSNRLFAGCKQLRYVNLKMFDFSNVKRIYDIFEDCQRMKHISFSGINLSKLELIDGQSFAYCNSLRSLYVPCGEDVVVGYNALDYCPSLIRFNFGKAKVRPSIFFELQSLKYNDLGSLNILDFENEALDFDGLISSVHIIGFDYEKYFEIKSMFMNCKGNSLSEMRSLIV